MSDRSTRNGYGAKIPFASKKSCKHEARNITLSMDYLRMDRKQGHVTSGNQLAIEREESFQNFKLRGGASPALLRPAGIFQD